MWLQTTTFNIDRQTLKHKKEKLENKWAISVIYNNNDIKIGQNQRIKEKKE